MGDRFWRLFGTLTKLLCSLLVFVIVCFLTCWTVLYKSQISINQLSISFALFISLLYF